MTMSYTRPEAVKLGLLLPMSYRNAHAAELDRVCNGGGAAGYGLLIPDTMYLVSMTPAFDVHDWMYHEGGTDEDKDRADDWMLENLHRIIKAKSWTPWMRWMRKRRAQKYYLAVRMFGSGAFNHKDGNE